MTRDAPPVRAVYDDIAAHFAETRQHPWPEVETFLETAPTGRVGVDVGCGNGRHLSLLGEVVDRAVGIDVSRPMLSEAVDRVEGPNVSYLQADAAHLPIADRSVTVALSIATVHHLRDRGSRLRSLIELDRVLAPGGRALVSVWATAHDRFDASDDAASGFDTTVDWTLPDGTTVPRFYHIYALPEFEADLADAGVSIESAYLQNGNCYAIVGPSEQ